MPINFCEKSAIPKKEKDIAETEEEKAEETVQEEMVKNVKVKETFIDVPDLEPEKISHRVNGAVEIKEEKPVEEIIKMPLKSFRKR